MNRLPWMAALVLAVVGRPGSAIPAPGTTRPESIVVVSDDNYPPYIFRDSEGTLRGILPDQWALWEHKTGVKVDLQAMDWAEAQRVMGAGRAHVIDTIFRTPEREGLYDFTPPYAEIRVPVYAHRTLGGIADPSSLHGFTIGVKAGDAVIGRLAEHGIDSIEEYPSYNAILQAAMRQELKVFSVDEPAAVYYLYKYGIADEYRKAFVLYSGQFHRAVHKGDRAMLSLVQNGFGKISPQEYSAIEEKWMGIPIAWPVVLRRFTLVLLLAGAAFLILAGGNLLLQHRIRLRTAELRESRARLERILHLAPIGIGVIANRRVLEANEAFSHLLGYAREELIGRPIEDWLPSRETTDGVGPDCRFEEAAGSLTSAEWWARRKDGARVPLLINAAPLNPKRPAGEIIFTAMDLTGRKHAEEERLNYERRIQEAQKIESLGLLAGGIAHDFNNLLTAILGNIDLALLDIPRDSSARADLSTAMTATRRAADLAQQMLAFSGKGHFSTTVLDVGEEIRSTVHILHSSISPNARLRIDLPATLPAVEADASQLRQVLMNLVLNASEALEQQPGDIQISAGLAPGRFIPPARLFPEDSMKPGPHVYVEVADTGIGIRPELLDKLFDPFFSTKITGRGLGLAAVLGIMRRHQGAIQVNSVLGKGTTFRAYFPASLKSSGNRVEADSPAPIHGVRAGIVLLVDDDQSLRETACKLLAHLGYQVLCASSGEQAIQLFRSRAEHIRGVILDQVMPEMDGRQTLEALRRIRPEIPVAISSGFSESEVLRHFLEFRPDGFIQKPYTLESLRNALDHIWR